MYNIMKKTGTLSCVGNGENCFLTVINLLTTPILKWLWYFKSDIYLATNTMSMVKWKYSTGSAKSRGYFIFYTQLSFLAYYWTYNIMSSLIKILDIYIWL